MSHRNMGWMRSCCLLLLILVCTGFMLPSPVQGHGDCPGDWPTRLGVNMQAAVTAGDPSTLWDTWKGFKRRVSVLEAGSTMLIIDGPECGNGIVWWQVQVDRSGAIGWLGEGSGGEYWLEPVGMTGGVWRYDSEPGGGSGEQVLTPTDQMLTCDEIEAVLSELIRGDTLYLYYDDGAQGVTPVPDPESFYVWLETGQVLSSSGWAFRVDEAIVACPGLFDPHTGDPILPEEPVEPGDGEEVLMLLPQPTEPESDIENLTFDIVSPRFRLIPKPDAIDEFNELIDQFVADAIASMEQDLADSEPVEGVESSMWINYRLVGMSENLISVLILQNAYYAGAAHPVGTFHKAINYDLQDGRELALAELFLPGTDYLTTLADLCESEAAARGLTDVEIAPTAESFRNWNLGVDGLLISFDTYEIGPYAAGPIQVTIAYQSIQEMLDPGGPAAEFTRHVATP